MSKIINGITTKDELNELYGETIFTYDLNQCPTYQEIMETNKFNIYNLYKTNQLVKYNDVSKIIIQEKSLGFVNIFNEHSVTGNITHFVFGYDEPETVLNENIKFSITLTKDNNKDYIEIYFNVGIIFNSSGMIEKTIDYGASSFESGRNINDYVGGTALITNITSSKYKINEETKTTIIGGF